MTTTKTKPRVASLAPQFLVDDLARSIAYYEKARFHVRRAVGRIYAIGQFNPVPKGLDCSIPARQSKLF